MYNIYYTYVPLDKLESGLEQEISFIEECISCKNKHMSFVWNMTYFDLERHANMECGHITSKS